MTRYLNLDEVLKLHAMLIDASGGSRGVRHFGGLDSAVAQPQMTFDGVELYPDKKTHRSCGDGSVPGNQRL